MSDWDSGIGENVRLRRKASQRLRAGWPPHARTHGGLRRRWYLSPYWNWNGIRGSRPAKHTKVSHALVFPEKRMDVRPRNVGTGVVSKVVGLPGAITNRHKSMG